MEINIAEKKGYEKMAEVIKAITLTKQKIKDKIVRITLIYSTIPMRCERNINTYSIMYLEAEK